MMAKQMLHQIIRTHNGTRVSRVSSAKSFIHGFSKLEPSTHTIPSVPTCCCPPKAPNKSPSVASRGATRRSLPCRFLVSQPIRLGLLFSLLHEAIPTFAAHALVPLNHYLVLFSSGAHTPPEQVLARFGPEETPAVASVPALIELLAHAAG